MKKSQSSIIYLVLLVLAIGAVYVVATKNTPSVSPTTPQSSIYNDVSSTMTLTINSNPTETILANGWKQYESTRNDPPLVYSINHPAEWTLEVESYPDNDDSLVLKNEGDEISVSSFVAEGSSCFYPDRPDSEPGPYRHTYTEFKQFKVQNAVVRRSKGEESDGIQYVICQLDVERNNYSEISHLAGYQHITYKLTSGHEAKLATMDKIIQSIKSK